MADSSSLEGGCTWNNAEDLAWVLDSAIHLNLRQLLVQAYCVFSVYNQHEVFIMLVSGAYFSMLKFTHPEEFEPLPEEPVTPHKKRKRQAKVSGSGEPKCQAAKDITNPQLVALIPPEHVEVIYHKAPVFDDTQARHLRLSDAFRQALRERLDDIDFQPCSLFDLRSAQYMQNDNDLVRMVEPRVLRHSQPPQEAARHSISEWYSRAKAEVGPKTPHRTWQGPYVESPINGNLKEALLSPEFKGKASGVGARRTLQRKSKDIVNLFRSVSKQGRDTNSYQEVLSAEGNVGGSRQDEFGCTEEVEDEGEGSSRLVPTDSEI